MDWLDFLVLILIAIGGGFVQRVSGFGLGIFVMMFLPHFTSTHTAAAAISGLFSCVTSTYNAIRYRKDTEYKTAVPMICAALISIPIAVRFASVVSADIFKYLLGAVLIVLSIYFLFFSRRIRIQPNMKNGILAGAIGGTLSGLFSTGGPPAVLYLSNATKSNAAYFATIQFYFGFTSLYSTATRVINGIVNRDVLLLASVGMIGCMIGNFLGKRVFHKLDGDKLKKVIYIGMIFSGIVMFF